MYNDKIFEIGDEVYVFETGYGKNFITSLQSNSFVKGIVIEADNEDYGYHGSGDWHYVYTVKGDDGVKYIAGDYVDHQVYSREQMLEKLKNYVAANLKRKQEICDEMDQKNKVFYELIKKVEALDKEKGRQYTKKRGK